MVDDRASPSAGWREVAREMGVSTDAEEPVRGCPTCGRESKNVLRDVYECEEHGVFRASAGAGEDSPAPADAAADDSSDGERDPSEEATDRATGRAD
ncbi:hypothetical protein [Halorussus litoreus]|uniref:hypothetical protein n=1 Tax=Halorussus litoreus TaxID=1710536 RepID=UPI000E27525A|nr:hypothetical protein [Halorussus litoreus]